MKTTFSCFIVDDNEVARLKAVSFVRKYAFLEVAGIFDTATAALAAALAKPPDVLFLDVDMPGLSGLELREKLMHIPACIFITSYPDYAMEGFEKDALDFLVKPIQVDRFAKAMERLKDYLTLHKKAALLDEAMGGDTIFIKDGYDKIKIQLHDIIYLEALRDYTSIVTAEKKYCVLSLLGNLLKEKSFASFIRIHRSYAVQKKYITKIAAAAIEVGDISLPLGRSYKEALTDL